MSDTEFKIGANTKEADAALDELANKTMTIGQRMQSSFREASYKMASEMKGGVEKMNGEFEKISKMAQKVQASVGLIGLALTGGMGINKIIEVASEFEQLEIRLNSVMGSAKAGEQAFAWIKQFAATTPNSVKDVTAAFMTLKNFGLDPMDGTLKKVTDATAKYGASAQATESVTLALGQAWARGKLQGQDTLQMINAGIPVYDLLSKATGKTAAEIQVMSEKGTMGRETMRLLIDEMGKASEGAAEAKMKSFAGAVSNMGDAFANAIDDLRKQGGFNFITESILKFTQTISPLAQLVGEVFGAVGDVVNAMYTIISDVFTGIGNVINTVFGTGGTALSAMEVFINMIKVVQVAIVIFRGIFAGVFETIKFLLAQTAAYFINFAKSASKAITLDFTGAKQAWKDGDAEMKAIAKQYFNNIEDIAKQSKDKIDGIVLSPPQLVVDTPTGSGNKGGGGGTGTTKKAESRVGGWEADLAAMRDAFEKQKLEEGSFQEYSKAQERDYWKKILDTVKLSTDEKRAVSAKYYALERDLRKSAFEAELAEMKNQSNAYQAGSQERVQIAEQMAKKIGEKYGIESKEYKAALDEIRQMQQAHQKQVDQLNQLAVERSRAQQQELLDLERVRIEESAALGDITQSQKLQKLAAIKEQEFQLELQAAQERAALLTNDVVAYQQAQDKILEIKRKHEIDKANTAKDIKIADKAEFDKLFSPIDSAFDKTITGILQGTNTLKQGLRNAFQSIALEYAKIGEQMVMKWIANQARQTLATATGTATRTGIETAGAAKSMAISGGVSFKSIMNDAYEAMAGAYKAIAGIPIVGPALAPVVAAGAFAGVAGLASSVMSSKGGDWQIPSDRLNIVHAKETILPADKSAGLDRLITDGTSGGAVNSPVNIYGSDNSTLTVSQLKKLLKQMNRDFVQVK